MKNMKLIILLCACTLSLPLGVIDVHASDGSQDVTVSYSPSDISKYHLEVIVVGNGRIFDGVEAIEGNFTVFELKFNDEKTFMIEPAEGYELKSIIYDETDITNQLMNSVIKVTQTDHNTQLTITFLKIDETEKNPEEPSEDELKKPDNGNTEPGNKDETSKSNIYAPKTGDMTNVRKWAMIGTLSGTLLLLIFIKKKRNKEKCEEGEK